MCNFGYALHYVHWYLKTFGFGFIDSPHLLSSRNALLEGLTQHFGFSHILQLTSNSLENYCITCFTFIVEEVHTIVYFLIGS